MPCILWYLFSVSVCKLSISNLLNNLLHFHSLLCMKKKIKNLFVEHD